jgi:DNA polymerase-3 subunit epsilon
MKNIDFPLKLEKPIVFFDLETTGTSIFFDRIIEISAAKIHPDQSVEIKTRRINPTQPIPPEATAIHGIKDEDVANEPTFKAMSNALFQFFENCDIGGYNAVRFDIPILTEEFKRSGLSFSVVDKKIIDPQVIFHKMEPRDLSAALKFYCGKEMQKAHSAEADIIATMEIFVAQMKKYENLPRDLLGISRFCSYKEETWIDEGGKFKWKNGDAVVNFGKNNGRLLKEIAATDPKFLQWIINASFSADVVEIAKNALIGKFPEKK